MTFASTSRRHVCNATRFSTHSREPLASFLRPRPQWKAQRCPYQSEKCHRATICWEIGRPRIKKEFDSYDLLCNLFGPPLRASRFSYQPSADLGRHSPLAPAAHALAGLPDGAGLVLMDPAEVPNQLESRRRAARDHQPAFQRGRGRCAERVDSLRSIRNFVVLVSTAAADRARVTPCPSRIQLAEA